MRNQLRPERRFSNVVWRPSPRVMAAGLVWQLLSGCGNGEAKALRLPVNAQAPRTAVFSPNGKVLATGWSGQLVLTNVKSGKLTYFSGDSGAFITSAAFIPDGGTIITGQSYSLGLQSSRYGGGIRRWNVKTGESELVLNTEQFDISAIAVHPDSHTVAIGLYSGDVLLWDLSTGSSLATVTRHSGEVSHVAFSTDGAFLASGAHDATVHLHRLARSPGASEASCCPSVWRRDFGIGFGALAFNGDGKSLVVGSLGLRVADVASTRKAEQFSGGGIVGRLAVHPKAPIAVSAPYLDSTHAIYVWSLVERTIVDTLRGHGGAIEALAFSPDGTRLASVSDDNTIRPWPAPSLPSAEAAASASATREADNASVPKALSPWAEGQFEEAELIGGELSAKYRGVGTLNERRYLAVRPDMISLVVSQRVRGFGGEVECRGRSKGDLRAEMDIALECDEGAPVEFHMSFNAALRAWEVRLSDEQATNWYRRR